MPDASPDDVADGSIDSARPKPEASAPSKAAARGRPDHASTPLTPRDFALLVIQLVLCTILVWQFELEPARHLLMALVIACAAFVVNVRLRPDLRPAWFAVVSAASVVAVLGWSDGLFALTVAGALIAAAALPLPYWPRVGVVLALGAVLTWMRSGSAAVYWPVVGSMFMFRMISYLHAARKNHAPRTLVDTAGYFLMLPNAFFPLFPVVDAKVFRDTWYNDEPRAIYQMGVHWIATGILHLFLYRVIKYELLPSPLAVHSLSDVLLYLAANYALYLRVSGNFHVICGVLHLFGWNLPRTHDSYFLASSFSDIWRRINIYWKDFLMKTFFYPAYFALRTRPAFDGQAGNSLAIAVAVVWVFFWTWLAHSWQTYWLVGRFPFEASDAWMWLAVGGLVAVNSVLDYRRALLGRPHAVRPTWSAAAVKSAQIMAMFLTVSLFWAGWTNRETLRYVVYVATSKAPTISDISSIGLAFAVIFAGLTLSQRWAKRQSRPLSSPERSTALDRQAGIQIGILAVIVVVAAPHGIAGSSTAAGRWIARMQVDRLTPGEAMAVVDGYYEQLATPGSQGATMLGNFDRKKDAQGDLFSAMLRPRSDLLGFELIPGWRGVFSGNPLTINRWGMRDVERSLEKPDGVVRIAVIGSSVVMGYGVKDDETMTQRLEQRLNSRKTGVRYEVLNFGSGRYYAVHRRLLLEKKILAFEPDAVIYVAHQDELRVSGLVASAVVERRPLDDDCLENCVRNAGIKDGDSEGVVVNKMNVETFAILRCTYNRLVQTCRDRGVALQYVYLPIPGEFEYPIDPKIVIEMAQDAGMTTSDLSDWWQPIQTTAAVVPDTQHPTAAGQEMIANQLYDALVPVIDRLSTTAR